MPPAEEPFRRRRLANATAIAVILAAGLLSAAWAFIVPIFQATDEAAHFDYAISIFSAGRLVGTRGATAAWIASPYTRYLLGASDYFRIAFHSSMRVPRGYGTLAFYRKLDANAPSVTDPTSVGGSISYIAAGYPFGFYALEALWMKGIALASGSLVAMFFGARLLCVFLTMLGLYFSYRTALNIGVPPWVSVTLVAAAGFFPLTTLVSSYVQPDNLAFTLVSASLFFATQLRASRRPFATTVALGISLGLLAVTKYHFFVAAAIPTVLLAFVRLRGERLRLGGLSTRVVALGAPAIALMGVQLKVVGRSYTPPPGSPPPSEILASLYDVTRSGLEPTFAYLFANSAKAFLDFFVTGPNAATYWGEMGLWDTPLIVVNAHVELALRTLIALASITVAGIIGYRLIRNSAQLVRAAARGHAGLATLVATSDPVLPSYALFVVLLFALYVASDNVFGAVGRQWYPYVFAAFLCAAWYAPRTLPSSRARAPIAVSAALAAYAFVASGYATAAIVQRYYGASEARVTETMPSRTEIVQGSALGALWPVQGMDFHPLVTSEFRDVYPPGSRLWVGGAAIFPQFHSAAQRVAVVVDGRFPARTVSKLYNFQIAEATRDLAYGYSGFFGTFGTKGLREGVHAVHAYAAAPYSKTYQEVPPTRVFFLAPGNRFSSAFLQWLASLPAADGSLLPVEKCDGPQFVAKGDLNADARPDSVVWLLVDDTPYPAQYAKDGRSFWGRIPAAALAPGRHVVSAFVAEPQRSRYWRIAKTREIVSAPRPPAECSE